MSKDLHAEPFDEGTKLKLKIFDDYIQEWLPVFLKTDTSFRKSINIVDFFAGTGKDVNNCYGSPLIIIKNIKLYEQSIKSQETDLKVYLNEYKKAKFDLLKENVKELKNEDSFYQVYGYNLEFKKIFEKILEKIGGGANLLILDQNGIKQITPEVFQAIINIKLTDFIFFISSSYMKRFGSEEEFRQYSSYLNFDINKVEYYNIHREVCNSYKKLIPKGKEYYLAPFSIKKENSIYGVIFGSGHPLGLYKFLKVCWEVDPIYGEANYDIDKEKINPDEPTFFEEINTPNKVQAFECELSEQIIKRSLSNNHHIVIFALTNGFLPSHAKKVVDKIIKENKIKNRKVSISMEALKKQPQKIEL